MADVGTDLRTELFRDLAEHANDFALFVASHEAVLDDPASERFLTALGQAYDMPHDSMMNRIVAAEEAKEELTALKRRYGVTE